jgi:exopolysaccharide biosynthesis polyprenyl glycosylphosphotransferase
MLIRRMSMFPQYGYHICGVVDDELDPGTPFAGSSILGRIEALPRLIRDWRIDEVFLAVPGASRDALLHLIKTCEDQQVEFKIVPDLLEVMTTRVALDAIDGIPLIGVRRNRLRGGAAVVKRAMDILFSTVFLIIASPVMLLTAIVVKLTSPGPVLFRQERVGLHGQHFEVYKFRTMIDNAEAETGPVVATKGDDRCTPAGRVMRRLSLDELPQLFNVLRGDMSLVGPRPMRPFLVERYSGEVPRYLERHQVRPGITGWAEVNDLRGAAPVVDRAMYDIYYIENWSLVLDFKILVLTVVRLLFQRHAY